MYDLRLETFSICPTFFTRTPPKEIYYKRPGSRLTRATLPLTDHWEGRCQEMISSWGTHTTKQQCSVRGTRLVVKLCTCDRVAYILLYRVEWERKKSFNLSANAGNSCPVSYLLCCQFFNSTFHIAAYFVGVWSCKIHLHHIFYL